MHHHCFVLILAAVHLTTVSIIHATTTIVFTDQSCGGATQASCSPMQCLNSTMPDCAAPAAALSGSAAMTATIKKQLPAAKCKQCTQSKKPVCQNLSAVFKSATGIFAAYCNDEYLVVWSNGMPKYDPNAAGNYLHEIPLPPADDTNSCRVRTAYPHLNVFKIPINPTPLATGASNTIANPLPNVPGLPNAGAIGVAIDGVPIFPNYNNRDLFTWTSCEVDKCNAHAGKGNDYHYHGDPFGTACTYSSGDYSGSHPPLIGFSLDGFWIYGRHLHVDDLGQNITRDACGGHTHGDFSYHYHSDTHNLTTSSLDGVPAFTSPIHYAAYEIAPSTCFHGDLSTISNFWVTNNQQANYARGADITAENDFDSLKPCCGSQYWLTDTGDNNIDGQAACSPTSSCTLGKLYQNSMATSLHGGGGMMGKLTIGVVVLMMMMVFM